MYNFFLVLTLIIFETHIVNAFNSNDKKLLLWFNLKKNLGPKVTLE